MDGYLARLLLLGNGEAMLSGYLYALQKALYSDDTVKVREYMAVAGTFKNRLSGGLCGGADVSGRALVRGEGYPLSGGRLYYRVFWWEQLFFVWDEGWQALFGLVGTVLGACLSVFWLFSQLMGFGVPMCLPCVAGVLWLYGTLVLYSRAISLWLHGRGVWGGDTVAWRCGRSVLVGYIYERQLSDEAVERYILWRDALYALGLGNFCYYSQVQFYRDCWCSASMQLRKEYLGLWVNQWKAGLD